MGRPEPKLFKIINIVTDIFILNLSFLLSYYFKFNHLNFNDNQSYLILYSAINISWLLLYIKWDITVSERGKKFNKMIIKIIKMLLVHTLIIFAIIVTFKLHPISRLQLFINYSFFFTLILLNKFIFFNILKLARILGFNYRKVIIVGDGPITEDLHNYFSMHLSNGFKFIGYFADNVEKIDFPTLWKGKTDEVKDYCTKEGVDEIYCALSLDNTETISDLIKFSDNNLIRFRLVPDFRSFLNKKVEIDFFDNVPVLSLRKEPLGELFNRVVKRSFDILFSLIVILLVFPIVLPVVAFFIKLSSKGPIFFKQLRSGRDNKEFYCYKFRTMRMNAESDKLQATKGDPRITRIGSILRKTNLDELPQFFNVLLGQMSVVGPRPHMLKHTEEYSQIVDQFMVRHFVKPGITGLAQVKGYRGETNHPDKMKKRVQLDVYYLENWNFTFDIKIIFQTVVNMVKGQESAF